jgi:uncharacterized membrane protein YccC
MIRKIISVIAGYAVFAVSSVLLFVLSGHQPHQDAPVKFKVATLLYGIFFALLSGVVVQLIARQKTLFLNFILSVVISLLAGISLINSTGSHWTQYFAVFVFGPVSIWGGYIKNKWL